MTFKRKYISPEISEFLLDNEVSLVMMTQPIGDPDGDPDPWDVAASPLSQGEKTKLKQKTPFGGDLPDYK